jgi:hypothetical protein
MKGLEAPARSSSALRGYGVMKWQKAVRSGKE